MNATLDRNTATERDYRDGPDIAIYVASLADYNAGVLHGVWIDATQTADGIMEDVTAMLAESKQPLAEEWAIHDYEGFGAITLSEWETFDRVSELANAIEEHGDAFAAWAAMDPSYNTDPGNFEEAYQGDYQNEETFAEELVDSIYDLSDMGNLAYYFDYEKFARDLFMGDYTSVDHAGGIYVFRSI